MEKFEEGVNFNGTFQSCSWFPLNYLEEYIDSIIGPFQKAIIAKGI